MNEKPLAALEKLIVICKDGEEGFQLAADEMKTSTLQSLFLGYSLQRSRLGRDLEEAASALGRTAADSGAARTWMLPTEAAAPRDEQAVLAECERGEDEAVAAYAAALAEAELPPAVRALLTAQATEVKNAHDEVRGRRTRFAPEENK